jgi:hypothetical protein
MRAGLREFGPQNRINCRSMMRAFSFSLGFANQSDVI